MTEHENPIVNGALHFINEQTHMTFRVAMLDPNTLQPTDLPKELEDVLAAEGAPGLVRELLSCMPDKTGDRAATLKALGDFDDFRFMTLDEIEDDWPEQLDRKKAEEAIAKAGLALSGQTVH